MNKKLPSISVIIPAYNEENNLTKLFRSLNRQKYPKNKIEYIVVNDNSDDNTSLISKKFGAKVYQVNTNDIELNKGIGLSKAKHNYVYFLDADMEVVDNLFFKKLAIPFLENKDLLGSFTREFSMNPKTKKVTNSLLRFISYDPLQRDPLYEFISTSIEQTIVKKKISYYLCKFIPSHVPPVGRILYKKSALMSTEIKNNKSFIDMESVEIMTRKYDGYFAYVPNARIRHYHANSLSSLIKKRLRNLNNDYLPNLENKYFLWFDPKNKKDVLKIFFWVIYANLFIPELIKGIFKSIYNKDLAFMWHPVVSIVTTDAIIYGFLKTSKGRKLAINLIKGLIS
ncbi:MAG: glycosyltransferase family 2 protein [Patescibacteria group bacterium]